CQHVAYSELQRTRHLRDDAAERLGNMPQTFVPPWPIVKAIVEINQKWRSAFQLTHTRAHTGSSVGNVVQHAQRVTEIDGLVLKRNVIDRSQMKVAIGMRGEIAAGYIERRVAGIDTVQMPYSRGHEICIPAGAAAEIEADRCGR